MPRLYTDGEIRTAYRQAKYKCKQIGILADLNRCSRDEIERIIGEDLLMTGIKRDWAAIEKDLAAGMTGKEVSAKHGVPIGTIGSHMDRIRKRRGNAAAAGSERKKAAEAPVKVPAVPDMDEFSILERSLQVSIRLLRLPPDIRKRAEQMIENVLYVAGV